MTDVLVVPEFTFGDRLRKARETAGVSLGTVAEAAGRSNRSVYAWERNKGQPRNPGIFEVARLYAELTGVDYDWLLTGVRTGSR